MDLYRLTVFVHIVFAILLVGLALFWLIMRTALGHRSDAGDSTRLLDVAHGARWPHVVIPYAWRLPLPWVAWAVFLVLCGTGIAGLVIRGTTPQGPLWMTKLALVAAIALILLVTTRRLRPALIGAYFALTLATIAVSGWIIR
jgi:hypothetical protein